VLSTVRCTVSPAGSRTSVLRPVTCSPSNSVLVSVVPAGLPSAPKVSWTVISAPPVNRVDVRVVTDETVSPLLPNTVVVTVVAPPGGVNVITSRRSPFGPVAVSIV
jgi:hypothetical protein